MSQGPKLSKIRIEAAPGPHEPASDVAYTIVAPLDGAGMIDLDAWREMRALCFVHKIEGGETIQQGLLAHRSGGVHGASWVFDYDALEADDETGFRFDAHAFAPGSYVSLRDAENVLHTYRVVSVKPA